MKNILTYTFLLFTTLSYTQEEVYYIGAGNDNNGVKVTSSTAGNGTNPMSTIDGSGMDARYMEATRFLAQSTIGYTESHVEEVLEMGFENWIDQQIEMPASYLIDRIYDVLEASKANFDKYRDRDLLPTDEFTFAAPREGHFNYTWMDLNMNNEDLIRQRVALALSEIFVLSKRSELADASAGLAYYYDLLIRNSFGNFRDLLFDVTMSPSMGFYLSHINNPKSDPENNISPDENYAREIMQLFTVGLYELNIDGSRKKDENGNDIPTYDQDDIKGLAKVFTGLGGSAISQEYLDYLEKENHEIPEVHFDFWWRDVSHVQPMKMYDDWHEQGEKRIIRDNVIPSGQTGMQDLNMALDILFNHENVGPFISKRLIQRLVKSNPSPGYITRISSIFNDNGNGIRGDLRSVVKGILLDEEARSCAWLQHPDNGKLREPMITRIGCIRSIDKIENEFGYYDTSYDNMQNLKQDPLGSPTVFNFFLPDYKPVGQLTDFDLLGPEFQIHDSHTAIGYLNVIHHMVIWETLAWQNEEFPHDWELRRVASDFSRYDEFNNDFESLINHIDKFYAHGRLSDKMREIVRETINPMKNWEYMYRDHIRTALNLILISPDYAILK